MGKEEREEGFINKGSFLLIDVADGLKLALEEADDEDLMTRRVDCVMD